MDRTAAVHECLFCPQTFAAAAQKDEHVLQHFSHELCADCNETLIQIGGKLYIAHSAATCIRKKVKLEPPIIFCTAEEPTIINNAVVGSGEFIAGSIENEQVDDILSGQSEPVTKEETAMDIDFSDWNEPYSDEPYLDDPVDSIYLDEAIIKSVSSEPAPLNAPQPKIQPAKAPKIVRNRRNKCNVCDKSFSCSGSLRRHKAVQHRNPDDIVCKRCGCKYNSEDELEAHSVKCVQARNSAVFCSICNKKLSKEYLSIHMRNKHSQAQFTCVKCCQEFASVASLKRHSCRQIEESIEDQQMIKGQNIIADKAVIESQVTIEDLDRKMAINDQSDDEIFEDENEEQSDVVHHLESKIVFLPKEQKVEQKNPERVECDICGKMLTNRSSLEKHKIRAHGKSDDMICRGCAKQFNTAEELSVHRVECRQTRRLLRKVVGRCPVCNTQLRKHYIPIHMRTVHNQTMAEIKCNQCWVTFLDKESLEQHTCSEYIVGKNSGAEKQPNSSKKRQVKVKRYPCDICEQTYSSAFSLQRHKAILHKAEDSIICNICSELFWTQEDLQVHMKKCKARKKSNTECPICGKVVRSGRNYRNHLMRVHNAKLEQIKCDKCSANFYTQKDFDNHACRGAKAKSNQTEDGLKVCEICGIAAKGLRKHMIAKHSSPDTPACTRCCRILSSFEELEAHQPECRLKMAQRPCIGLGKLFECYICRKRLKTMPCLQQHLRLHNPRQKIKCTLCDLQFFNQTLLKKHINQVHLNQRNFMCNICGQGLSTKNSLQHHMYRHTGEKPYKCTFEGCDKSFRTATARIEHMRVHTGEKPFHCEVDECPQRFAYPIDLKRHKFNAHGIYTKKHVCEICSETFPERMILTKHMKRYHS